MSHKGHRRRPRYGVRRRNLPGAAPGTLVIDPASPFPALHCFAFGAAVLREQKPASLTDLASFHDAPLRWLNVDGLGHAETLKAIGQEYGLHNLELEDIVNVHQRPKFEDYDDHLFLVLRMPAASNGENGSMGSQFHAEQVSMCLGPNFVLTFQEIPGDAFEPVRRRLRNDGNPIRKRGTDYLAYTLIDAVIDAYFPVLERFGERVESLENEVVERPTTEHITRIHGLKRDLLAVRRAVWPMRDLLAALLRDENNLVKDSTRVFLRDCHDHTIQLIDMIETYREITSGLVDIHLSSLSNRMNEVMKVLTIIATIFIPLTFIAGIYGMNFDPEVSPWNMPELKWAFGYPAAMLLMLGIAVGLLGWFYRKGWIGRRS